MKVPGLKNNIFSKFWWKYRLPLKIGTLKEYDDAAYDWSH